MRLGAISSDVVKHLLLGRIEQRPARLDLEHYPHLPSKKVARPQLPPTSWPCSGNESADGHAPGVAGTPSEGPTITHLLREYDKLAQQCAADGVNFPRYLLRWTELELLDRERAATERRIHQARFDVVKSLDSFDFLALTPLHRALCSSWPEASSSNARRTCSL